MTYDLILRHGTVYDGSGNAPFIGDVAIHQDTIAAVGKLDEAHGRHEIDATGLAVAPGFINMLSWATELAHPRATGPASGFRSAGWLRQHLAGWR